MKGSVLFQNCSLVISRGVPWRDSIALEGITKQYSKPSKLPTYQKSDMTNETEKNPETGPLSVLAVANCGCI